MGEPAPLEDLIAKLRDMEELLSIAEADVTAQSLAASRIRQAEILATYVRQGLERRNEAANYAIYADGDRRRKAAS